MQVERRTENRSDLTDWGGNQTERERGRNEEVQFVRAHQRRNIRLGRLLTKQNSTQLDWTWTGVSVLKTGVMNLLMGATTGCHRFKVLSLSLSLALSRGTSAFSNWNVLHHISAHYHLLLARYRGAAAISQFPSLATLLLHCALHRPLLAKRAVG